MPLARRTTTPARAWYVENRERLKAVRRAWYEANREEIAAKRAEQRQANRDYSRAYYSERRVERRAWQAEYNARNAEPRRHYAIAYAAAHPLQRRDAEQRRRTRKHGNGVFAVLERDWRRVLHRYRNACAYCGSRAPLTQEHVIPLSRGGRHSIGNLLPACSRCNTSKRHRLLVEWRGRVAYA